MRLLGVSGQRNRPSASSLVLATRTSPRAIHRLAIKVASGTEGGKVVITGVTFPDPSAPSGNIRGHRGDHTTAFVTFLAMVRNQVIKLTLPEAQNSLKALVENILLLPGMAKGSADYLRPFANNILKAILAADTPKDLEPILVEIVSLRNAVPLSASKPSQSSGGHGEGPASALLTECEDRFRREEKPRYTPATMVENMWIVMDYHPTDAEDHDVIAATIAQHIYSMQLAYPFIFEKIDKGGHEAMYDYLVAHPAIFTGNLSAHKVKPILDTIKKGLGGPEHLNPVGKSKHYTFV